MVDNFKATGQRFLTMLMKNVQLTGAVANDSQMAIHIAMNNADNILARVFQKHLSYPTRAHALIGHGKDRKRASKRKWMECEYHVQDKKYVQNKPVKTLCASIKCHGISFCGPHAKPHGVRRLSKH